MKFFLYCIIFLSGLFFTSCQNTHEIYIVRHAEKSTEPANDPHLTGQGKQRAETLKDILQKKNIKAIYSTKTNRTAETAMPLSSLINVPIQFYRTDSLGSFLQKIISLNKNALIVGHSNTLLPMINVLDLPHNITTIADTDFENIFIVKTKNGKAVKIIEATYQTISLYK